VPYFRVQMVARGEITKAIDILSPPTKPYSRAVAPGKVL
jgi:hypothetical protein